MCGNTERLDMLIALYIGQFPIGNVSLGDAETIVL